MGGTTRPARIVTAAALFDGHDAAINMVRRLLVAHGAQVIHLGHDRSVAEIAKAAVEEDADAVCVSSYQGGHMEFFGYLAETPPGGGRGPDQGVRRRRRGHPAGGGGRAGGGGGREDLHARRRHAPGGGRDDPGPAGPSARQGPRRTRGRAPPGASARPWRACSARPWNATRDPAGPGAGGGHHRHRRRRQELPLRRAAAAPAAGLPGAAGGGAGHRPHPQALRRGPAGRPAAHQHRRRSAGVLPQPGRPGRRRDRGRGAPWLRAAPAGGGPGPRRDQRHRPGRHRHHRDVRPAGVRHDQRIRRRHPA